MKEITDLDANQESLKLLYLKQVNRVKHQTKFVYKLLRVFLIISLVATIIFIIALFLPANKLVYGFLGQFIINIPIIVGLIYLGRAKSSIKKKINKMILSSKHLERESNQELYKICDDIVDNLEILSCKYELRFIHNNGYFPIMVENSGVVLIFIPRNFIKLFFTNRNSAIALLTHEFSHVKQNDTNNYLIIQHVINGIRKTYKIFFIILALYLVHFLYKYPVVFSVSMSDLIDIFLPVFSQVFINDYFFILFFIFSIVSYKWLNYLRRQSENIADTAVVLFASSKHLILCLKDFAIKDKYHPNPENRIQYITNISEHYKVA